MRKLKEIGYLSFPLALLLAYLGLTNNRFFQEDYASYSRVDGKYKIVLTKSVGLKSILPGQAGDRAGFAHLVDANGKTLKHVEVEMVQLVQKNNIKWSSNRVSIDFVADWDLPN